MKRFIAIAFLFTVGCGINETNAKQSKLADIIGGELQCKATESIDRKMDELNMIPNLFVSLFLCNDMKTYVGVDNKPIPQTPKFVPITVKYLFETQKGYAHGGKYEAWLFYVRGRGMTKPLGAILRNRTIAINGHSPFDMSQWRRDDTKFLEVLCNGEFGKNCNLVREGDDFVINLK